MAPPDGADGKVGAVVVYGGIEAGGTKFVCAVGTGPGDIRAQVRFPTTTPEESLERAVRFLREQRGRGELAAVGIASFGPIDPNPASPTYGHITMTPKAGWVHTDVVGAVLDGLGVPVGFDTDVNVAALGEGRWGAAIGLETYVYLTVGTGIGGGGMVNGRLMHGLMHPEMGHLRVPRDPAADPYPGSCPYHGDCLEGLACGPAIAGRWGRPAEELPDDHPAWALEAHYLGLGIANVVLTLSPQRVIVGGGVMGRGQLLGMVRREVQALLGGYVQVPALAEGIEEYIVPPALGARSGVLGALALAERAATSPGL